MVLVHAGVWSAMEAIVSQRSRALGGPKTEKMSCGGTLWPERKGAKHCAMSIGDVWDGFNAKCHSLECGISNAPNPTAKLPALM